VYKRQEDNVLADFAVQADEAFCCGTAAVISPIGSITHNGVKSVYGDGSPGKITKELYDLLTGIQNETEDDVFGWLHPLP